MLFNRRGNRALLDDVPEKEEKNIETEEELELRLQKMLKKQNRNTRIKRIIIYIMMLLIGIGGIKSLLMVEKESPYVQAINHYAFVEEYLQNYFAYPLTEENEQYLGLFATGQWRTEYDTNKIEKIQTTDCDIYHVEALKDKKDIYRYYSKVTLNTLNKDNKEETDTITVVLTIAEKQGAYAVVAPPMMNYTQSVALNDADVKELVMEEEEQQGTECTESERQELQNTIQLFVKTYMSDFTQARLLMENPDTLDPLDKNTKIELESFSNMRQTDDAYIVNVSAVLTTKEMLKQRRNYNFVIDKTTNKIMEMEES